MTNQINPKAVALLEQLLSDAKSGKCIGVGVVAVYETQQIGVFTEGPPLALHSGGDQIREAMRKVLYETGALPSPPQAFGSRRLSS